MRDRVLKQAVEECLNEMFLRSQPSITWKEFTEGFSTGKYKEGDRPIEQHYLSMEEYIDIKEKYLYGYNLNTTWPDNAQLMIDYLEKGGTKDKYIPESTDENGNYHPGYRGYESTPKLIDAITEIVGEVSAIEVCKKVFELINDCKNFYRGDRLENQFSFTVMNYSPCSSKERVQEFWGDKLKIYDTELDPMEGVFVKVTEEQLNQWEADLDVAEEDKDAFLIEEYTKLLQKYGRIEKK